VSKKRKLSVASIRHIIHHHCVSCKSSPILPAILKLLNGHFFKYIIHKNTVFLTASYHPGGKQTTARLIAARNGFH